jgi:hypothetical protein
MPPGSPLQLSEWVHTLTATFRVQALDDHGWLARPLSRWWWGGALRWRWRIASKINALQATR